MLIAFVTLSTIIFFEKRREDSFFKKDIDLKDYGAILFLAVIWPCWTFWGILKIFGLD
jgi:hypothetical protein